MQVRTLAPSHRRYMREFPGPKFPKVGANTTAVVSTRRTAALIHERTTKI